MVVGCATAQPSRAMVSDFAFDCLTRIAIFAMYFYNMKIWISQMQILLTWHMKRLRGDVPVQVRRPDFADLLTDMASGLTERGLRLA